MKYWQDISAPPPPQICHSFRKTQKNDSDLTPPSLFARCHSFYRFFILKASLSVVLYLTQEQKYDL